MTLRRRLTLAWLRLVQPLCEWLAPPGLDGLDFVCRLHDAIDELEDEERGAR